MGNPVGWFEIYVEDMTRAKSFYETVFEVELTRLDSPAVEMWAFPMGDQGYGSSGSLVRVPGYPTGANSVLVYFTCDDCSVRAARAVQAGGRVFREKFPIGKYGYISLVYDTEGNLIGLHSMN